MITRYNISQENSNPDVFSHLPLPVQSKEVPMPEELVLLLESLEISTVNVISNIGQIMTQS